MSTQPSSITCPTCHMTSNHPMDVLAQYCGNCNKFHGEMEPQPKNNTWSDAQIIVGMLTAYYNVVSPGEPLASIRGTLGFALIVTTMRLIIAGKEPWGSAEEAAYAKMREMSAN